MNRRTLVGGGVAAGLTVFGATALLIRRPGLIRRQGAGGEPVRTDAVTIPDGWRFEPRTIEVPVGTTVTWTNDGAHNHTVTFDEEAVDADEDLAPGEETSLTFQEPGTFEYHCRYHLPDMVGTVIVTEG